MTHVGKEIRLDLLSRRLCHLEAYLAVVGDLWGEVHRVLLHLEVRLELQLVTVAFQVHWLVPGRGTTEGRGTRRESHII